MVIHPVRSITFDNSKRVVVFIWTFFNISIELDISLSNDQHDQEKAIYGDIFFKIHK